VLADPTGEFTGLHARTQDYPPALAEALVDGLWEARFLVAGAREAAARTDTAAALVADTAAACTAG